MEFTLTIRLGNDAMQSGEDIARALGKVSTRLEGIAGAMAEDDSGRIMDTNGNAVGEWSIAETAQPAR